MDTAAIVSLIAAVVKTAVDLTPKIIQTVEDAAPFAEAIYNDLFGGADVTPEQAEQLKASIAALEARLNKPLPPQTDQDV